MKRILILLFLFCFTNLLFSQEDPDVVRLYEVYSYISQMYVDDVPKEAISEAAVIAMLKELDPHSTYIPKDEVERANERINGSFVGVGIRFNILNDTLLVVNPIPTGPAEKLGIRAGDQIIQVDGENIAGIGLKNSDVRDRLLGDKGTKVKIEILRNKKEKIRYTIVRDNIPVNSIVASYMVDDRVGYIKLTSFSRTTNDEVNEAIKSLKSKGMKDLIFDLQGNGGGLLYAAKNVANQFLGKDKLIVYSEGRANPRTDLIASGKGLFEKGRLVILIDESSASASEILSGAIQDWDRGLVVGRRSFGKGLVQRPLPLSDGAQLRLTIARYFTPSGRFIQKPYDDFEEYQHDYINRYEHGEMMHRDSIKFPDSLIHQTLVLKRDVYGGGGIMPDLFIPLDTSEYSNFYKMVSRSGAINSFAIEYANENREMLSNLYTSDDDFKERFYMEESIMTKFLNYINEKEDMDNFDEDDYQLSERLLKIRIKAMIAQNIWSIESFYKIYNEENEIFMGGYNALRHDVYGSFGLK